MTYLIQNSLSLSQPSFRSKKDHKHGEGGERENFFRIEREKREKKKGEREREERRRGKKGERERKRRCPFNPFPSLI